MRPRGLFFWLLNRICKPYNGLFLKQSWLHFSHTIDSLLVDWKLTVLSFLIYGSFIVLGMCRFVQSA